MSNDFITSNLITYIGNKRALIDFISKGLEFVQEKLGKDKLSILDGFSGSGCVARLFKYHATDLYVNDLETYSRIINECYLSNPSATLINTINTEIDNLNNIAKTPSIEGFITKNYAPKDDNNIKEGERVFYTHENAMIIDTLKDEIFKSIPANQKCYYLAPLLVQASIHTNTSGVFKGFHKKNGIGHFGGAGENALQRIKGKIVLEKPTFLVNNCNVKIYQKDTNELVKELPEIDLAYYDPPYNQHPYGSNYFMLNIIANDKETKIQTGVSGISEDWNKSLYNKRKQANQALEDLIKNTKAKYIMISYNNEGIIPINDFQQILSRYGNITLFQQEYNTYRGSRNLNNRNTKVKELLWILEKTNI